MFAILAFPIPACLLVSDPLAAQRPDPASRSRPTAQAGAGPGAAANEATGFQKILWVRAGRRVDAAFTAVIHDAGFDAVNVSGGRDPAVALRHGLRFYSDQICGKGLLELREAQYRPLAAAYAADRKETALVRPSVLSSTSTLLSVSKLLGERLAALRGHRPLAVSLGDEISVTRHANPLDFCFAPETLRQFRAAMRVRYREIGALNRAWATDFTSFDQVRPFTADAIRSRELDGRTLPRNLAPWAAHREFMDREMARLVRRLAEQVARTDATLPCGLTGIQPPSAYGGHDYARLLPALTCFEVYDIGGARNLAMSLAPPGARQVATLFPLKPDEDPRLVTARLADMVAHGMWGTVVWSSREVLAGGRDGRPALTRFGAAVARGFAAIAAAAPHFADAEWQPSPVWLVESPASVRAWWMLDSRRDGATWIRRLSSYEATHSTSLAARHSWVRLLEDLGLQGRFVPESALAARLAATPPRLLVLPATIAISDAAAAAIREYVGRGGTVVADHTPGLYDERLHLRKVAALDPLFGVTGRDAALDHIRVHEGRATGAARRQRGAAGVEPELRARLADPVGGCNVQMERAHGRGRAFYLNLAVCEYGRARLDPKQLSRALGLRQRLRRVMREAGVAPPVLLQAKGMPTCLERSVFRTRDGRRLLAVRVNALESPAILADLAKRGPYAVRISFRKETIVRDLCAGKEHAAALQHDVPLDPYLGLFLEVRRP